MMAADAVRCMRRSSGGGGGGDGVAKWSALDINAGVSLSVLESIATKISGVRAGCGADTAMEKNSGQWYVEFYIVKASSNYVACGFAPKNSNRGSDLGQNADCYGYHKRGGRYFDGSYGISYSAYATGDTISLAVDLDSETVEFFKNGVSQGLESVTLDASNYTPAMSADLNTSAVQIVSPADYLYAPPAGYSPWVIL